ncbi:flagellar biosynthetic protein FliR [Acanthopleuribacter pedis]|uniref:Flagellar biosynthetic protein FliR n=1 Tax=Acanthopleuribacter pedis TaxID=442870 RepID=A0A8J7U7V8_9BACT|nr:flagellar biosynthetic protein FliR [Acanthopleuribacter pedis]MBO1322933.1 flagellar biosynthetic protein FliR [Acanthopleuribacter pedis]
MNPLLEVPTAWLSDFVVVSARVGGIMAFAPVFGAANIPVRLKVLLAAALSWVFTGFLHPLSYEAAPTSAGLIIQLAAEITVGAAIGFTAAIIFEIVIFGGYLIDYFIGFGFINIVDPQSGSSISIFAFFYSYLALIVFLVTDAHHIILEVMMRSYDLIPVFGTELHAEGLNRILDFTAGIFYIGFQIAAPMFLIMFTIDFSLGMISKTVPQLQVLVVGFPFKISVGLLSVALVLRPTFEFFMGLLTTYRENLFWLIKYFGAG